MDFKYAIFDLDGTLVDSMSIWRNLEIKVFTRLVDGNIPSELKDKLFYMMWREMFPVAQEITGKTLDKKALYAEMRGIMTPKYKDGTIKLKKGVIEFLEHLKENGIKCAVATATPKSVCYPCVCINKIDKYFDAFFTTEDAGKNKFSPDVYDLAMNALGGDKQNTMVFEDTLYCINTLKENGYRYTIISEPTQSKDELINGGYIDNNYIEDYFELIK